MHYLLGVQLDESVFPLTGADLEASMALIDAVNDDMRAKGVWVFAGGLRPSADAAVVREHNGTTTMTDGPFAETKEQLGGFWVIEVADRDAAMAWAQRCAAACWAPIEVRPFDGIA